MMMEFLNNAGLAPSGPAFWLVVLLAAGLVAALMRLRTVSRDAARRLGELGDIRVALAEAEIRADAVDGLKDELAEERARREALEGQAAAQEARLAEREKTLDETRTRLDAEFKAATAEMLDGAHKAFFERTKQTFERYQEKADAEGANRRKALDELLKPVSDNLTRYQQGLAELRKEQQESRGALSGQIKSLAQSTQDVRAEAQKLATALRAGPKTRGRWGEEQLRNVVEMAGMAAYVDFIEQAAHTDEDNNRKQPDMVVRLPGERVVAVDSKVSLGAYLDAVEAETDEARATHLARHADDLWAHVKSLAVKDYAASLRDSLDYVVMFVPGENYFAAAMEARPALYQDAFDKKILIATPTILIAVLKSAGLSWRQEKITENAHAVAAMAEDLYDSLRRMGDNLSALGRSIEGTVKKYNTVVGNVEGRVLPRARKFAEYELQGTEKPIEEVSALESAPRELRAGKDLLLSDNGDAKDDAA